MNIREALSREHSRLQTSAIVDHIGDDPRRFAELMRLFLGRDRNLQQRAAWPLIYCLESNPALAAPYFRKLIDSLRAPNVHDAVRRGVIRSLQFIEIPERYAGEVFSLAVDLVDDPRQPPAIRVFAMSVAAQIAEGHPDLMRELRQIVRRHIPDSTAAFKARARLVFKGDIDPQFDCAS